MSKLKVTLEAMFQDAELDNLNAEFEKSHIDICTSNANKISKQSFEQTIQALKDAAS